MEQWRRVWREGLAPQLPTAGLEALGQALARDDSRLIQQFTTNLPSLRFLRNEKVEATCALGYCGWQGEGLKRLGQVFNFFERVCTAADEAVGELAASNHFLNWYDNTPRHEMRRQLLAEVQHTLHQRFGVAA
jgi:hypothetical protein